ncbi:MAG: vitamin K epoxide reductase family protein [Candidatus Gastranaerophilaceae bacterium]|jgi:protein-disulfide isomerase/uncharacterized membrane protein
MTNLKSKINEYLIPLIAILGLITTIKLTLIYINANFVIGAQPSFCAINDYIDCDAVAKSQFSYFLGVPNSIWGMLFYLFILFLSIVDKIKKIPLFKFTEVFKNPQSYIFCLSIISIIVSLFLAWISSIVIHKLCLLCYVTYFLNIILFAVSKGDETMINHFKNSFKDFFSAIINPGYAATAVILSIIGVLILFLINKTEIFIPFNYNNLKIQIEKYKIYNKISGNVLGDKNATVLIHEYTDFECPYCAISNGMMHKLVAELNNVEVIHHNYPLDKSCNPNMKHPGHKNSCMAAKYALAAKAQNKFWDFNSIVFENNENLNEKKILELAKTVGLDTVKLKKDAYSPETAIELSYEIKQGNKLGVTSTPSYRIRMKLYEGLMSYPELKAILIKAGAKPKTNAEK